jgi:membrane protein DedA with SNARE-associated domain
MLASLARHSFVVVLLAVMVEELGIPMPIPTDILIIYTGAVSATSVLQLGWSFVMLSAASAIGTSSLYVIVRRGTPSGRAFRALYTLRV